MYYDLCTAWQVPSMNPDKIAYSDQHFWQKVFDSAIAAGREVIEKALWLYYAAEKNTTPPQAKLIIYAALAYFISPVDTIPDPTPAVGYADDLGVLAMAIALVAMNIDEAVTEKAKQKVQGWFG